jgi:hypothetical protein
VLLTAGALSGATGSLDAWTLSPPSIGRAVVQGRSVAITRARGMAIVIQ